MPATEKTNPFDSKTDLVGRKIVTGLLKIGVALKSHSWKDASERGLTPTQKHILSLLLAATAEGFSLTKMAEGLGVTAATASDAVKTLTKKGLLEKQRSEADARSIIITLTANGRKEAERNSAWPDFLLGAVDELDPAEQQLFMRVILKMIRRMQERGEVPVSQMCVTCSYFKPYVQADPERPHFCNLVNAHFGDSHLKLECPEHKAADSLENAEKWATLAKDIAD